MEDSILWTTNGTGDGAAGGYTQAEAIKWQQLLFMGGDNQGVAKAYLDELAVMLAGGNASPASIATGAGLVYGFPYWNTAAGTKAIETPAGSTRCDLIVLKADWAAQTVRIDIHAGAEGGGTPSPIQTPETTWEIPLAAVSITTGGVASVTDMREFLRPNLEIGTALVQDNFMTGLPHASLHIRAASDEIDGDKVDIDWNPSSYTPAITPAQVTSVDELTAHLFGIDTLLGAHKNRHDPNDGGDALDTASPSELASVQGAGVGSSHSLARADHQHQIQHSTADNHLLTVDGTIATNDIIQATASGLKGLTYDEVLALLSGDAGAAFSFNSQRVTSVADPTADQDAATRKYVNNSTPIGLWPDKTAYAPLSGVQAAGIETNESSSGATAKPLLPQINFDASTDEGRMFLFRLPQAYSGSPVVHGLYKMAGANAAKDAEINVQVAAFSDNDVDWSATAFDTTNTEDERVPAGADDAGSFSVTISNPDGMVAGDWICLFVWIDVSDSNFAGDFQLMNLELRHE